jgi:hypothetical protein
MTPSLWKETALYEALKLRRGGYAEAMTGLLIRPEAMDAIETILISGGTTPRNFTLHDAAHSFRVAQRSWELIPAATKQILSEYELGLLLLAAHLHDIGMSPEYEKVRLHEEFLTTDRKAGLTAGEIDEFQRWIDENDRHEPLDIRKEKMTDLRLAEYTLAYYIRHKHNDWSGDWIEKNLDRITLADYPDWKDDLVRLCKSHHHGIEHLERAEFDPKPVGPASQVHLRYLAMCLRVADVMEVDPERTPGVILRHRAIDSESVRYWLKDRPVTLRQAGDQFVVFARPDRAVIHKAVEDTAQQIENELKLCEELIGIKPLNHASFNLLKGYEWGWEAYVRRDIRPKGDAYVYIQGAFRPNTARLLELFGGHQLYGDSLWAFRELIQNAFDAVKERIAYFIVQGHDLDPAEYQRKLGDLYGIEIRLEERPDGAWLVCHDDGVGMTRAIIEKFFLESGTVRRHEIVELDRRCREKGFILDRTGQFGIGVLSYFMLAERIVVRTGREPNSGYPPEGTGWHFEINGMFDFGELRQENGSVLGTEIALKLRAEIAANLKNWDDQFREFIRGEVAKSPCRLSYSSSVNPESVTIAAGWNSRRQWIKESINKQVLELKEHLWDDEMLSADDQRTKQLKKDDLMNQAAEACEKVDFIIEDGKIEGFGTYRIHLPFFHQAKGPSFYYLRERLHEGGHELLPIGSGRVWSPEFERMQFSLKGVRIEPSDESEELLQELTQPCFTIAYIELDIETIPAENLSVSRHTLLLGENFLLNKRKIDLKAVALVKKQTEQFNNCYGTLNWRITRQVPSSDYWAFYKDAEKTSSSMVLWRPIEYPFCLYEDLRLQPVGGIYFRGKKVNIQADLNLSRSYYGDGFVVLEGRLAKLAEGFRPAESDNKQSITRIVVSSIYADEGQSPEEDIRQIDLPEAWSNIVLLRFTKMFAADTYLNERSPYSKYFDIAAFNSYKSRVLNVNSEELPDARSCFNFLICAALRYSDSRWIALCEQRPTILEHVFAMLDMESFFIYESGRLTRLALYSWERLESDPTYKEYCPPVTDASYLIEFKSP